MALTQILRRKKAKKSALSGAPCAGRRFSEGRGLRGHDVVGPHCAGVTAKALARPFCAGGSQRLWAQGSQFRSYFHSGFKSQQP